MLVVVSAIEGSAATSRSLVFTVDDVLQALPLDQRQVVLGHQQGVLKALTAVLVQRTQLSSEAAAASTADARDLPEEMRMVSRAGCGQPAWVAATAAAAWLAG